MKKALVAALLGMATMAVTYGQGHVLVWNYGVAPYNQVYWDPTVPTVGNQAVMDTSVNLQFFYALGTVADPAQLTLSATPIFHVNTAINFNPSLGHGGGGYFDAQDLVFSGWSSGSGAVTVMLVATGTGGINGHSALFTIPEGVVGSGSGIVGTASPANQSSWSPALAVLVPEPSTFALAGLGSAALLIFRRRR